MNDLRKTRKSLMDKLYGKMKKDDPRNYVWFVEDGKFYYLPNMLGAYKKGFFKTEDTNKLFIVTGIYKNLYPICLKFEEYYDNPMSVKNIPIAKRVIYKNK